jgi:hypothetical protein
MSFELPPVLRTHQGFEISRRLGDSNILRYARRWRRRTGVPSEGTPTLRGYPHPPRVPPPSKGTPTLQGYPHPPRVPPPSEGTPTLRGYPHPPRVLPPSGGTPTLRGVVIPLPPSTKADGTDNNQSGISIKCGDLPPGSENSRGPFVRAPLTAEGRPMVRFPDGPELGETCYRGKALPLEKSFPWVSVWVPASISIS